MINKELTHISAREAFSRYKSLRKEAKEERGEKVKATDLTVARRFTEQYQNQAGLLIDLHSQRKTFPILPPAIAILTEPSTAATVLRHGEFDEISSDTLSHKAFKPFLGEFLFYRENREDWMTDRKAVMPQFVPKAIDEKIVERNANGAIDSAFDLASNDTLQQNWIKYLAAHQITRYVLGATPNSQLLSNAIDAHSRYGKYPALQVLIGNTPSILHNRLVNPLMKDFFQFHDVMGDIYEQGKKEKGVIHEVVQHLPEEKRDARDILSTLVGGLSTLRSYLSFTLLALAEHPEYQERAAQDSEFMKNIVYETGRVYPPAPYVLRKAEKDIEFGDMIVPKESLVIFGAFAYGNSPSIDHPEQFDPLRDNLKEMATRQGGPANVFSYGPRACIAKYLGVDMVTATSQALLRKYSITCDNQPNPVMKGISLGFDKPAEFRLIDKETGESVVATSN